MRSAEMPKGVIRIVFAKNPPDAFTTCNSFPTMEPSIECPFPGWLVEVVKMLTDYLNLRIEPIIISSGVGHVNWGHYLKGNWTGILNILERGMADTVCTLYPYTEQKAQFFNFSHPVTGVRDMYIARPIRKSISLSLWNAFLPYEPRLWLLLLISLGIQCGLATLVANMEFRLNLRPNYDPLEKMWQYLRLQIRQATEFQTPFFLQSGNLAFLFYALIQATLFTQLYTALLLSALIRGGNHRPWDNYIDMVRLVKNKEYRLVMDKHHLEKDNSFYETLSYTGMSHLRNLMNAIEHNPIVIMDNVSQALDSVEKGGYILPTKQYSLAYQLSKERCDLFYFEDDHNQIPTFFIFSRKSKMLKEWNKAIRNNQAFIRRTYEKYFFHEFNTGKIPNCQRKSSEFGQQEGESAEEEGGSGGGTREASPSLDIVSTFGIFLIALIGYALALLAFLCELLVHAKARRLARKWRTRRALVMANPSHLMAIASTLRARRHMGPGHQLAHMDSQQSSDGVAPIMVDQQLMGISPAALLHANPGPPRLAKTVGRSWWRTHVREQPQLHRQRSIICAVTLAAISMQQSQEQQKEPPQTDQVKMEMEMEMVLRQRQKGGGNWAMLEWKRGDGEEEEGGGGRGEGERGQEEGAKGWARTAF